ncbi:MAG: patatin-like phospholipase family protein [Ferruginibacter sp.]
MRSLFSNIFYSLPVQLFVLHFRKYQVLLFFWYILFSTAGSSFMKNFGADALFFAPEYLGKVTVTGAFITGLALGVFIMSWNISGFILHSRRLRFLATTSDPFLKYCINNSLLPIIFLVFYFIKMYRFDVHRELMTATMAVAEIAALAGGVLVLVLFSFAYFFGAGRKIDRSIAPVISNPQLFNKRFRGKNNSDDVLALKVKWYFNARFHLRPCRNVSHYRSDFLDAVFHRHHIAAIISILFAFVLIVTTGLMLDYKIFEMPAAASILIVFALLIALIGALAYFLQSWSLPAVILLLLALNFLYSHEIIDPRNKAYGLDYENKQGRPSYDKASLQALCTPEKAGSDRQQMLSVLNKWKAKQHEAKPLMIFINVSGGGLRSAAFTMNALQKADSISGGELMKKTFLISGASGGMLAAAYYRELYRKKLADPGLNIADEKYTDNIAGDLLNPVFSSLMARDIFAPMQKFTAGNFKYVKDRGYAFEKKLGDNSGGLLNRQMKDLQAEESEARIPLMIFNSVIKTDARKLMISTQPLRFMMKPFSLSQDSSASPDAVDFAAMFHALKPMDLRMLTALRMNATFPYVLPNVWLPSNPVIDVMDAGLRDNFGQETSLRFISNFTDWIKENTAGVLILQIRDRFNDNWQQPFETKSITDMFVTPATMLQHNWFKLQDYHQSDEFAYFPAGAGFNVYKSVIMYMPEKKEGMAALNFHLSAGEKRDVIRSFNNAVNRESMKKIGALIKQE